VDHEGKALAADEIDAHHERTVGLASVHVRAVVTWLAIFPLVALGMCLLSLIGPRWNPVLRALVLTLIVVPTTVYLVVPRLLSLYARAASIHRRKLDMRAMKRQLKVNH
jgi:antibiotic biosynthesis monooxygenase (ABM) superfamily enzyme